MPIPLTIRSVTYQYPVTNDQLWGQAATDWAQAVTSELNQIIVDGDLGPTVSVVINNNQAVAANVTGLVINSTINQAATIEYYVYRTFGPTSAEEIAESGIMMPLFKDTAASWTLVGPVGNGVGSSGVTFTITAAGQIQYTSDNRTPNPTHTGKMRYRLRVLPK